MDNARPQSSRPAGHAGNGHRQYLPHVDGLRAIAVLCVLLFHCGVPGISGGYVGVDVFLVISGYLMTVILSASPLDAPAVAAFLRARVRRIVPAYLAMGVVVALLSFVVLLPYSLEAASRGLLTLPVFLSNFTFWRQTSYFSPDLADNPLLHTWSLALEAQFYLAYLLLFLAVRRLRVSPALAIAVAAAASFLYALRAVPADPTAAFYLLPARLWEFLAGAAVALLPASRAPASWAGAATLTGLAAIAWCAHAYTSQTPFPGTGALLPALGAALVVWGGMRSNVVGRILAARPLRTIGAASYSIYLWHWPLIVFLNYRFVADRQAMVGAYTIALVAGSLALGFASWKFVEAPFRGGRDGAPPWIGIRPLAYLAIVPALAGAIGLSSHGAPSRVSPRVAALSAAKQAKGSFLQCLTRDGLGDPCHMGMPAAPPSFLVVGDSHAMALADGLDMAARLRNRAGILLAVEACPPLFGLPGNYSQAASSCREAQDYTPVLLRRFKLDTVILHADWSGYYRLDDHAALQQAIDRSFAWWGQQGIRVVVISDVPGGRQDVPLALARQAAFGVPVTAEITRQEYDSRFAAVNAMLGQAAAKYGLAYLDLGDRICGAGPCPVTAGETPLYWDDTHLSAFGSRYVMKYLDPSLP